MTLFSIGKVGDFRTLFGDFPMDESLKSVGNYELWLTYLTSLKESVSKTYRSLKISIPEFVM